MGRFYFCPFLLLSVNLLKIKYIYQDAGLPVTRVQVGRQRNRDITGIMKKKQYHCYIANYSLFYSHLPQIP